MGFDAAIVASSSSAGTQLPVSCRWFGIRSVRVPGPVETMHTQYRDDLIGEQIGVVGRDIPPPPPPPPRGRWTFLVGLLPVAAIRRQVRYVEAKLDRMALSSDSSRSVNPSMSRREFRRESSSSLPPATVASFIVIRTTRTPLTLHTNFTLLRL